MAPPTVVAPAETPAPAPVDQSGPTAAMPGPTVPTDNAPLPPKSAGKTMDMKILIGVVVVVVVLAAILYIVFK